MTWFPYVESCEPSEEAKTSDARAELVASASFLTEHLRSPSLNAELMSDDGQRLMTGPDECKLDVNLGVRMAVSVNFLRRRDRGL